MLKRKRRGTMPSSPLEASLRVSSITPGED
jgi:hypothetical protein